MTSMPPVPLVIATQPPKPNGVGVLTLATVTLTSFPRNVDLEHIGFVVALLAERGEHLLVLGRNVLRPRDGRERQ